MAGSLYAVLMRLIAKAQTGGGGPGSANGALYQPGHVVAVRADGTYDVRLGGATVNANPETDLPLRPGQPVWVSPVRNGRPLVHGPR
jgi:hypothetical protein